MKEGSEGDGSTSDSKESEANNTNATNGNPGMATITSPLRLPLPEVTRVQVMGATLAAIGAEVAAVAAAAATSTTGDHTSLSDNFSSALRLHGAGGMNTNSTNVGSLGGDNGKGISKGKNDGGPPRDKIFVCGVCNRCFGYKHVLQNHERTHTGEKPFECKECHKRFTRDHHLKTHMRLHTGEKPYHCTHCERQFVQVANLRRHLRVHTGERPYACELCTSRFSDSNQLKAHMLIHKGEKPFECKKCLGRFRRRHHLMHHKCPKDEENIGKPRRGRRPRAYDELTSGVTFPDQPLPRPEAVAMALGVPQPQPPPVAHSTTHGEKSRRKPSHTIRILTPAQRELFLRDQETMQTQPIDMSISPTPDGTLALLLPRSSSSTRFASPAVTMDGVLDLSNSRSDDSEAEPIEEEVEEIEEEDLDEEFDDDLDTGGSEDDLRQLSVRIQGTPWDKVSREESTDGHDNGDQMMISEEESNGAFSLTTSS